MNRTLNTKIKAVQKEQVQLVHIEKALEKLLSRVNTTINELKVEELQIKSSIVEQFTAGQHDDLPTTSAQAAKHLNVTTMAQNVLDKHEETAAMNIDVNINSQMLALESLLVPFKQKKFANVEEEEEDDDDDEVDKHDKDYNASMDGDETEEDEDESYDKLRNKKKCKHI